MYIGICCYPLDLFYLQTCDESCYNIAINVDIYKNVLLKTFSLNETQRFICNVAFKSTGCEDCLRV